jgi:HCOMODA/2-hydroxy-3-carboxy-muconic semialdehyde decarboxylase
MGATVPHWDSRDDFGDTNLLVIKPEEGASLARALGPNWVVLMGRHGATVAGRSLHEVVFRTVYSCQNAEYQARGAALGTVGPCSPGEIDGAAEYNLKPGPIERAWEYWTVRLERTGQSPARARTRKAGRTIRAAVRGRRGKRSGRK